MTDSLKPGPLTGAALASGARRILLCSCEQTMPIDVRTLRTLCPNAQVEGARQLCRDELHRFEAAAASGLPLIVACGQEGPLFTELAPERDIRFVNLRETAGWSSQAAGAGPKMAALVAAAAEAGPDPGYVALTSQGVLLIYGCDETALEAAGLLKDHLDVTVLLRRPIDMAPPRVTEFPVVVGRIRSAKGRLGAFEITVDQFAHPSPSSRAMLVFGEARDGAVSRCDILLDLSGGPALFSGGELRDGYLRADPRDPAAVARAALKARGLVGTFDKPRYIAFDQTLCAHSRSGIKGCTRCLDLCPAGAIAPAGDHVRIDAEICAGCGQCAAACPTGAADYALPPANTLMRRIRTLLLAYRAAGGERPVVLLHDEAHGAPLIDALARFGDGLPANVLPLAVNEVTQVGIETIAAAFAYGASAVRLLLRARPRHDIAGLSQTVALATALLDGYGFGPGRLETIETDDPDALGAILASLDTPPSVERPSLFMPVGGKREVLRLALQQLHRTAPAPIDRVALPGGAPIGGLDVDPDKCTLCLSCVSACPTGALTDNADRPMLRFAEAACVQCGLCQATCPERAITLKPQFDVMATAGPARVMKQEEPFHCTRCDKPFGVKSTIDRVGQMLAGKHWMYQAADPRLAALTMCSDCRMKTAAEAQLAASAGGGRAPIRTTDDYLREREPQDGE
jgi:ferredoxin